MNFESYYGLQQVSKLYDMMNATQFATYLDSVTAQNNRFREESVALPYTSPQISGTGQRNQLGKSRIAERADPKLSMCPLTAAPRTAGTI